MSNSWQLLNRRAFLQAGALAAAGASTVHEAAAQTGERLYNGIEMPAPFPPRRAASGEPMPVPYLSAPPGILPLDGRPPLLVADFLIDPPPPPRTFHSPIFPPAPPVLKPDKPWEQKGQTPTAMPFSDGIWYDPKDRLFKMWYMGGYTAITCYATSADGLRWDKPEL